MQPPPSQEPYPPPAPYQQPPSAPQYQQLPPQYTQPAGTPPPANAGLMKVVIAVVVVVVLLVVMVPLISVVMTWATPMEGSSGSDNGGTAIPPTGTRVTKNLNGDWLIDITSGSMPAGDITIEVIDPNTGARQLSVKVNAIPSASGTYNDNNGNSKLDAGDTILLLRSPSSLPAGGTGVADAGDKVQFLKGETVACSIKELPS